MPRAPHRSIVAARPSRRRPRTGTAERPRARRSATGARRSSQPYASLGAARGGGRAVPGHAVVRVRLPWAVPAGPAHSARSGDRPGMGRGPDRPATAGGGRPVPAAGVRPAGGYDALSPGPAVAAGAQAVVMQLRWGWIGLIGALVVAALLLAWLDSTL